MADQETPKISPDDKALLHEIEDEKHGPGHYDQVNDRKGEHSHSKAGGEVGKRKPINPAKDGHAAGN